MRPLKNFEEFLRHGVVKRRTPDLIRAKSLINEAEKRKKFLGKLSIKIGLADENANYFIETSYDTLIELIRAKMLAEGFKTSGEGAHEAEVSYMRKFGFSENEVRFMNDLRYFRNGILYYGKDFDSEYGNKVLEFLNKIYPVLLKLNKSSEHE